MNFLIQISISAAVLLASGGARAEALKDSHDYYPDSFYQAVSSGTRGTALKNLLFSVLNSTHVPAPGGHDYLANSCPSGVNGCYRHAALTYEEARRYLFGRLHLERSSSGYAIRDVYCQHLTTSSEFKKDPPAPDAIPDPSVINAEHTWPQSLFTNKFDRKMQKADLHILFPALPRANTSRSNLEFNEVVTTVTSPCPLSRRGYASSGNQSTFFEPPDVHKGNVARAIFYFSTRYDLPVPPEEEASLRAWHRSDPPDEAERERNELIFTKQKVRNPFIDHPELVDLISDF